VKIDNKKHRESVKLTAKVLYACIERVIFENEKLKEFYDDDKSSIGYEFYTYDFKSTGEHHVCRFIVTVPTRMLEQKEVEIKNHDAKVNVYDWYAKDGLFSSHFEILVTKFINEEYQEQEKIDAFKERMMEEIKKQLNYIMGNYHTQLGRMENMIKQSQKHLADVERKLDSDG